MDVKGPPDQKENITPTALASSSISKAPRVMLERPPTRIVRFGENEDELFLLRPEDTERERLVAQLKATPSSPEKWLQLLQCPLSYEAKLYSKVRLFRRATTVMDKNACRGLRSYAEIWVLFAKLQETEQDTRSTFNYMKTESIGEMEALYYEEYAAFEFRLGHKQDAEEILERGLDLGALSATQKKDLHWRIVRGEAGKAAPFSGPLHLARSSYSQEPQTTRDHKPAVWDSAVAPSVAGSPVSRARTTASASGFSTVSKLPRSDAASTVLATPAVPARPKLKSQSTSRKSHHPISRFKIGGPPLRVSPSNNMSDSSDEDEDDGMMGAVIKKEGRRLSPLKIGCVAENETAHTSTKPAQAKPAAVKKEPVENNYFYAKKWPETAATRAAPEKKKPFAGSDFSYIKNWAPRPVGSSGSSGNSHKTQVIKNEPIKKELTKSEPSPDRQAIMATPCAYSTRNQFGIDVEPVLKTTGLLPADAPRTRAVSHASDHYPFPKRQQIDAGIPLAKHRADFSPHSPNSESSSSSPPLAALSKNSGQDPFQSLSSRIVVDGQPYIKLEQIGSGGSSKVYRILGPDLKIYALKKIKLKRLDSQSIAQYANEIELLRRLQGNPHIIKLISAEKDLQQRQINVVMEHGEIDLSDRLRVLRNGMDENFLRVIWTQMLQAVDAIHSERIIHGDLKPANFLFVNGALKLIDFGIAKAISNDTTNIERDSQVGTVNYMSPEAIQGNTAPNGQRNAGGKMKVGRASDIWSLGCILYQIVYTKPPFADVSSIIEKFRCIIDESVPIPFPSLKNKDLEDVIRSCLKRNHRDRPTINGENGLLNHAFLRSGGVNAVVALGTTVTLSNAPQVLTQLGDLLRSQGVDSRRLSTFLSIGEEGLGHAGSSATPTHRYLYNTDERRTEI